MSKPMSKPTSKPTIGQPGPGQFGYVAGYNGREVDVYAPGLFSAATLAEKFLQPPRAKRGSMWVILAETPDGAPVVHVADF